MTPYPAINGDPFLERPSAHFGKLSFGGMTFDSAGSPDRSRCDEPQCRPQQDRRQPTHRHNENLILPELSLGMDVLKHCICSWLSANRRFMSPRRRLPVLAPAHISTVKP
jgi:hypothetical protein